TFAMTFGMPIMQLLLFGYAINNDPKGLPTALIYADQSATTRSIVAALSNTGYFRFDRVVASASEADELLRDGKVQFVLTIPSDFTRRLVRGESAQILVEADATDPATTGNALAAVNEAILRALAHDLDGPLAARAVSRSPVDVVLHRRYNPEGLTRYNV